MPSNDRPVQTAASVPSRPYLLERVDDAAVVQLYADGFAGLPLDQKTLIWHLYEAALWGRDIYYDQRHRSNLAMRDLIEAVVRHPDGIDADVLAEMTMALARDAVRSFDCWVELTVWKRCVANARTSRSFGRVSGSSSMVRAR